MSSHVVDSASQWARKSTPLKDVEKTEQQAAQAFLSFTPTQNGTKEVAFALGDNSKEANEWKEKGNTAFGKQQWREAIECYTKALQLDNSNPVYPANRAMAYLKLNDFKNTVTDCDTAINLDPNYVKAWARRGTAHQKLRNFSKAHIDLSKAIELEPGNVQVKKQLQEVEAAISKTASGAKQPTKTTTTPTKPTPSTATTQQKPRQAPIQPTKPTIQAAQKPTPTQQSKPTTPISSPTIGNVTQQAKPNAKLNDKELQEIFKQVQQSAQSKSIPLPKSPPNSFYDFLLHWNNLSKPEDKYAYLKMIEPRTYTKIFGESLSSAILTDFLKVVDRFYLKKDNDIIGAVEAMTQLAKVPRFDILSLFFGEAELTQHLPDFVTKLTSLG